MSAWSDWTKAELDAIRRADRLRETRAFDGAGPEGIVAGRKVVSYASNDYLGLSIHPRVRAAAIAALQRWGSGSGASRLITGTRSLHHDLESAIADWKHAERALVFPTGYAANLGVLSVFGTSDTTLFSDSLNHASIIDGCRLAKARTTVYRHGDLDHLKELFKATAGRKVVVTDLVFSMDGDVASLEALSELCMQHRALLVLDEAHAVFGPELPEGLDDLDCIRVGTLSKTLGALGGWVAGPDAFIQLLVNRARTFIYTTAPSPADTAAALAAVAIYRSDEGASLRARLRALVDEIRPGHPSAIIPVILGTESAALAAAGMLFEQGIYVPAIRPPTVPPGTARLRVALSSAHTDAMIAKLRSALAELTVSA